MARLILSLNNKVLSNYQVSPGKQITIGRRSDNDIVIDNLAVSAHHATIRAEGPGLMLTDMGSRNGTYVNNERVDSSRLAHQDWVTIGKHILIVDLHESLSLESTADELMAGTGGTLDADQTMVLERDNSETTYVGFDYLSFMSSSGGDYELSGKVVSIGKNPDADIKVPGFWSLFAGSPSVTITKRHDNYILTYINGLITPRVNGKAVKQSVKLNHQDIIKVGPLEAQIRLVRRPAS